MSDYWIIIYHVHVRWKGYTCMCNFASRLPEEKKQNFFFECLTGLETTSLDKKETENLYFASLFSALQ